MTKIENLNRAITKDINFVFLKKILNALVQELNKYLMSFTNNVNKLVIYITENLKFKEKVQYSYSRCSQ